MRKIAVVGGGTAGWITASILIKGLDPKKFEICLVESPDIPTIGVGEATIPPIVQLASFLEINHAEMLTAISGTYKFGIEFQGWSEKNHQYMHAFGFLGTYFNGVSFPEMWLQYKESLDLPPFKHFIPSAVAAYANKFSLPYARPDKAQDNQYFPLTELFHAYQFDASLLANYLKQYAIKRGVTFIANTVDSVQQNHQQDISHLVLSDGSLVKADYFVDCSGARSIINKQTLKGNFTKWGDFLPCDRAVAVQTKLTQAPFPYTKSIAMNSGWRWHIPLQHRTGNGYVYSSDFCDDEDAIKELDMALSGQDKVTELKTIRFETGHLDKPWNRNSIAIGLSSGFLEPLESTSIHLTHKYALELMNALRFGTDMFEESEMYNKKFAEDVVQIRDFIVLHYHAAQKQDTAF